MESESEPYASESEFSETTVTITTVIIKLFESRYKFALHMVELAFVLGALGASAARMFIWKASASAPPTRANTMALSMGAKSIILILYQVLTERVPKFKKWASLKAYLIINALEIVFWAAVVFLMVQANISFCEGTNCTISWGVVVVAGQIALICAWATVISWKNFRHFKKTGEHRGEEGLRVKSVEEGTGY